MEVDVTAVMVPTLTIAEAARRASMHPNTLRYWIDKGMIEVDVTVLGRVVRADSFDRFLASRVGVARRTSRNPVLD